MKIAEFKIRLIFIFALSIALSSCSKSEDVVDSEIPRVPMVFSNRTPDAVEGDTKTGEKTSSNWKTGDSFGVYASLGKGFGVGDTWGTGAEWLLDNKTVTVSAGSGTSAIWTYDGIRYWPNDPDDKITFVAYHPNSTLSGGSVREPIVGSDGFSVDFVTIRSPGYQEDLLYDVIKNATKLNPSGNSGVGGGVGGVGDKTKFTFKHALSKVSFIVKTAQAAYTNIQQIALKRVTLKAKTTGTFNLGSSLEAPHWTSVSNVSSFVLFFGSFQLLGVNNAASLTDLLLIPQTGDVTIDLEYDVRYSVSPEIDGKVITESYVLPISGIKWKIATYYRYILTIGLDKIDFAAEVEEPWTGGSDTAIPMP